MVPKPSQISGAKFLSARKNALLADEPRVGKTGAAIMAADDNLEQSILVVTTSSGRPVWRRAFSQWQAFPRKVQVGLGTAFSLREDTDALIISWAGASSPLTRAKVLKRRWDRIILDEAHYAKNFETARTKAAYGVLRDKGLTLERGAAIVSAGRGAWCLTGTPLPHDPSDIYPMLRALAPERLLANKEKGWPNVMDFADFRDRYCRWRPKKLSRFKTIIVIMGGKNEAELRERIGDFMLRRTQKEVGIVPPIYETFPLEATPAQLREANGNAPADQVLRAAKSGATRDLEMHMGPLRRHTGLLKVPLVVQAVREEFESGLDKIVLAYWHKEVGQALAEGLSQFGIVGIDGSTSPNDRAAAEQRFLRDPEARVFLGQIEAAGEAIDLSSAAELWFVETVFSPRAMKQMSLRITNHMQTRQACVRVCVLEGSIDAALQEVLLRLWTAIREVLA